MERSPDGNGYILKTGRVIRANRGILGLTPALDELTGGYDQVIATLPEPGDEPDGPDRPLDYGERREIADHQIALWERFAEWGLQRERIEAAAIRLPGDAGVVLSVPRPGRHSTIIAEAKEKGLPLVGSTQGFVTSEGRFVERAEAFKIARDAGQLLTPPIGNGLKERWLYSEDVW